MNTTTQIQIFSDLHIEIWNKLPELPVFTKYLFLAGDICSANHPLFYKFFDYCSARWEKIFYVPGNHEFYHPRKNYNELIFEYKYAFEKKYKNVFYLDNDFISLNDEIDVYGSTFWRYPAFDSTREAKAHINDYANIRYFHSGRNKIVNWDISYVKKLSKDSYYLLQNHLAKTKKKTIVVTHYPPRDDESLQNFHLKNVSLWISGHTHRSHNIERYDCKFVSNQLGFKHEVPYTGISENGVFDLIRL